MSARERLRGPGAPGRAQRHLQALLWADRRAAMILRERAHKVVQPRERRLIGVRATGPGQRGSRLRLLWLGHEIEHVALLVRPAALHERMLRERLVHGLPRRGRGYGTSHQDEQMALGRISAIHQVRQQRPPALPFSVPACDAFSRRPLPLWVSTTPISRIGRVAASPSTHFDYVRDITAP